MTEKEIIKYKKEIEKFRTNRFSKFIMDLWFKFIVKTILPVFILIFAGGIMKNNGVEYLLLDWVILLLVIYFFGYGILIGIAYILEVRKVRKECKRLGISKKDWNYIVKLYGIERK